LLKKIVDAEFDLICWRKGDFEPLSRSSSNPVSSALAPTRHVVAHNIVLG
jgi:hypothetical protein